MPVERNEISLISQLEPGASGAGSDRNSSYSESNVSGHAFKNNIARRLFDNDRLDRKLRRHHLTCECRSVYSTLFLAPVKRPEQR